MVSVMVSTGERDSHSGFEIWKPIQEYFGRGFIIALEGKNRKFILMYYAKEEDAMKFYEELPYKLGVSIMIGGGLYWTVLEV